MLKGLFLGIIGSLINIIRTLLQYKRNLKMCRIEDVNKCNVEVFKYKDKLYDKNKYIEIIVSSCSDMKKKNLEDCLKNEQSKLQNSKNPEYREVLVIAYKKALTKYYYVKFHEDKNNNTTIVNSKNSASCESGQAQILFCRKCGNKLPEEAEFCNICGTKICI